MKQQPKNPSSARSAGVFNCLSNLIIHNWVAHATAPTKYDPSVIAMECGANNAYIINENWMTTSDIR
jgi:hypothetical protein